MLTKINKINQTIKKFPSKITALIGLTTFEGYCSSYDFFIAAMWNPSLKGHFMQEFNRFIRILAGYKILQLENK